MEVNADKVNKNETSELEKQITYDEALIKINPENESKSGVNVNIESKKKIEITCNK